MLVGVKCASPENMEEILDKKLDNYKKTEITQTEKEEVRTAYEKKSKKWLGGTRNKLQWKRVRASLTLEYFPRRGKDSTGLFNWRVAGTCISKCWG